MAPRRCIFKAIYLKLWYKIKDAAQKSTQTEVKIFRDFHSQMQFSLNKLHFPNDLVGVKMAIFRRWWGKGVGEAPFVPPTKSGWGWRKFLPAPKAPVKSWRFFHLENEVYLVKIAFASENLDKFSPPASYFFVQHL